jgi:hypothetical protein
LDPEGELQTAILESLKEAVLTNVLWAHVWRARQGVRDAALLLGTGKDLIEATARHTLVCISGSYPQQLNFPATPYDAFDRSGLAASPQLLSLLDTDPDRAFEQALYVLGNAANRLRNAQGTGHGRPVREPVDEGRARLAAESAGIVSQLLLEQLAKAQPPTRKAVSNVG